MANLSDLTRGCRVRDILPGRSVTVVDLKLRRERVTGKERANRTHREVGAKVRKTIKELGGTMPEELPVAEDITKLESKRRQALKADREE